MNQLVRLNEEEHLYLQEVSSKFKNKQGLINLMLMLDQMEGK